MNYDYKVDITIENNAHTQCLKLISSNSKVLDVGCAVGALGEYLYQEKNCEVVGVDFSEDFIKVCEEKGCYSNLFNINLNILNSQLDSYKGYFDYILLADVIEHIYSPEELLSKIKNYLKPEGKIILSVPNIVHGSIKLNLLKNEFNYTEMGLLDRTHIRFFTKNTINELVTKLKFNIVENNAVIIPFSTYYEPVDIFSFPIGVLNYLKKSDESYVYQYILKLEILKNIGDSNKIELNETNIQLIKKIRKKYSIYSYLKNRIRKLCKK